MTITNSLFRLRFVRNFYLFTSVFLFLFLPVYFLFRLHIMHINYVKFIFYLHSKHTARARARDILFIKFLILKYGSD